MKPGDSVVVDFDGVDHPGKLLKKESSGYLLCEILTDPVMDYGSGSAKVMPVQTVAVRSGHVRPA